MTGKSALLDLAEAAGIETRWENFAGEERRVSPEALRAMLGALGFPAGSATQIAESRARVNQAEGLPPMVTGVAGEPVRLGVEVSGRALLELEGGARLDLTVAGGVVPAIEEAGYHRLLVGDRSVVLAIAPRRVAGVERRVWGLAAQVYGLRRRGDGGIGDTLSVALLAEAAAKRGAEMIALSPLHALFTARPEQYGPYSPSSRLFLNPLLAAPELVFGDAVVREAVARAGVAEEFARLERLELIDWPAASRARLAVLRALFEAGEPAGLAAFEAEGGVLLARHACFEALQAVQGGADWRAWPDALRDPASAAVGEFVRAHRREVGFHVFLQFVAERSLAAAQARARAAGMGVGLIADLAVGMDPGGSHAWSRPEDVLNGLAVGAPPDLFNPNGQQWGITSFSAQALRRTGFAPFLATLRASLRNAGGVRIDHAMGLQRLWLVPEGAGAADGAYLRYPLTDLLRLLALEAERHGAIVVGEDLGTVPAGFREAMGAHGVLGMRVLWFEQEEGVFREPGSWDRAVMAMTTTHDLPTAAGWWSGADIGLRAKHGVLGPTQTVAALREERAGERAALWRAMCRAGVGAGAEAEEPGRFVDAAVRFVAGTRSRIALLPLEDVLGVEEQPNLPGTTVEHPNWRRRTPGLVETLLDGPDAARRIPAVAAERR